VKNKIIGILAIQGDFQAHMEMISKIGLKSKQVRTSGDLDSITHLIIPGGESTTIRKVARANGLWGKLAAFKGPVMGTCMGSIIMAKKVEAPSDETLGLMDIAVARNAYGRQINSFTADGKLSFAKEPFEMVFIRAPKITELGNGVEPIAWLGDEVTGVKSGNRVAFTFHPELTDRIDVHKYFAELE